MSNINFIQNRDTFIALWQRACACKQQLPMTPVTELLHFDSSNIGIERFRDLIRSIASFNGNGDFAVIVLHPDPFNYFHFHFGKYSGFIVTAGHDDDAFFEILMKDPGGSPADAIGFYSEQYVVLPIIGEWFMYADRDWDGGTGVLSGPADVMAFARESFAFYENPDQGNPECPTFD
ncbi:hypothetical protein PQQ51_01275 [Paraburkholderia xenovorans]|uniref:hypothetical protein n=1 Tax=Paraburkholderia xenovorans TaxID=36873 RepID=UPI0038B6EB28